MFAEFESSERELQELKIIIETGRDEDEEEKQWGKGKQDLSPRL